MKNQLTWLVALTALMALALVACRPASTPAVEGRTWVLQSIEQQDLLEGTEITAVFDAAKKQVTGSAGCNTYFGGYELEGGRVVIGPLAHTEMACMSPEGVMDQEQRYLGVLGAAETAEISGGELRITCSGGRTLLFKAR
jgi:heat shock protein HslJ